MKAVRRTKELSLNQMAIMVANLKEATKRDCSIKIEKSSWDNLSFSLYLASVKPGDWPKAEIIYCDNWEDLQQLYFNKVDQSLIHLIWNSDRWLSLEGGYA